MNFKVTISNSLLGTLVNTKSTIKDFIMESVIKKKFKTVDIYGLVLKLVLDKFSDIIIVNRISHDPINVENKIYTRDIFWSNS